MKRKKPPGIPPRARVTIAESELAKPIWKTYHTQVALCDASCEKYHLAAAVLGPELRERYDSLSGAMKVGLRLLDEATAAHDAYKESLKFFLH